jgi:small-conductance mechanosensitive channel
MTVADSLQKMIPDATTEKLAVDTTANSEPWLKGKIEGEISKRPGEALEIISFSNIFWAIIFILIGYYLIKFIIIILNLFAERSARFRITIKSLIPIVRIVIWTGIIFIIVKGIFDPPKETIITVMASIGIAVGLAASDLFKNIFGGITRCDDVAKGIVTEDYNYSILELK